MPLPTVNQVHINVPLTNIAEKWLVSQDTYIATKVFPVVPVQQMSGLVARYCRKDFFNTSAVRPRAPGAKSQGVGYHVNLQTEYLCRNYATRYELPDEVRANATAPLETERVAVQIITQRLLLKLEYLFAQAAFTQTAWSNVTNVNLPWNNANSTPITDVQAAMVRMHLATGFQPNTLVVNKQVFHYLRTHSSITAIYRNLSTAEPMLSAQQVADALGVERLLVASAVHDTGPMEGQWQGTWIFGNHALLCLTTGTPSLESPSAGYTMSYTGAGFTGTNVLIEQYRGEEDTKKDIFVGHVHADVKVVEPDLGVFFPDVVAGAGILNEVVLDVSVCE